METENKCKHMKKLERCANPCDSSPTVNHSGVCLFIFFKTSVPLFLSLYNNYDPLLPVRSADTSESQTVLKQ